MKHWGMRSVYKHINPRLNTLFESNTTIFKELFYG